MIKITVSVAATELEQLRSWAHACDRFGITALGIGDSPAYHETWISAAVAVQSTERLRVGPVVTNFVTRSPSVTASALRSLDELSGGRAFAGVGAGDSAVAGAGMRPASVAGVRDGIDKLRSAWPAAALPGTAPWRIVLATNGPATMRLGGASADVVVAGTGISDGVVERARANIDEGARRTGRDPATVELWTVVRMSISEDADAALTELRPLLASGANHVFSSAAERALLASEPADAIGALRDRYDYSTHGRRSHNPNAELVDELGLRAFLASRFALVGSPAVIAAGLRSLERRGVGGVLVPAIGLDVDRLIRRLGEEVLPALAAQAFSG